MQIGGSGALVAGGASGLGEATARRLHADGAHVVIADLNDDRGRSLAAELGERTRFVATDVTDAGALLGLVGDALLGGGGLRQHAGGHQRGRDEGDAPRAEPVGDDAGRERDRERRGARRREQRRRRRGREVVDGGEAREQRDERGLRQLGDQHEGVQQRREAARGPRSAAEGGRERSHACVTI